MRIRRSLAATFLCFLSLLLVAACTSTSSDGISSPAPSPEGSAAAPAASALATSASSTGNEPSAAAASAAAGYEEQALAWGREFAECARSHGIADFPDPVYPEGISREGADWSFTLVIFGDVDKTALGQAMEGCHDLVLRMPSAPEALQPPAPATLEHMREWAQCLREHGLSEFPDPRSDGRFPVLGTQYEGVNSADLITDAETDALNACQPFQDRDEWQFRAS